MISRFENCARSRAITFSVASRSRPTSPGEETKTRSVFTESIFLAKLVGWCQSRRLTGLTAIVCTDLVRLYIGSFEISLIAPISNPPCYTYLHCIVRQIHAVTIDCLRSCDASEIRVMNSQPTSKTLKSCGLCNCHETRSENPSRELRMRSAAGLGQKSDCGLDTDLRC